MESVTRSLIEDIRMTLEQCIEKITKYHLAHPEYVGGIEYTQLIKRANRVLGALP